MNAFVTLTPTTQVATVWFLDHTDGDVLGLVYRDSPTAPWQALVRRRDRCDDKIWGSADTKQAYRITSDFEPPTALVQKMTNFFTGLHRDVGGKLWSQDINASGDVFLEIWRAQPFVHSMKAGEPE